MFTIIACIGKNRELGKGNKLIFHLKDDLKFFQETTLNHKVVMGRKTWESLPQKLKNRENIVISRQNFAGPDQIVHNLDEFIEKFQNTPEEIFIIGGATIYQKFLPFAKSIYLTEVDTLEPTADAFFPVFDKSNYSSKLIKKGTEDGLSYQITRYIKN
ncbi:dihydrofolate reductase [Candidatus Saccharibacteria bacterium]|nr:dihydrofolate reductase [Candidatus Saccharibacteria bacterium]